MTDQKAPFLRNELLYEALKHITPVVLRDFRLMRDQIGRLSKILKEAVGASEKIADQLILDNRGPNCDACVILRNMHHRYLHDLNLYDVHLRNFNNVWREITRINVVNSASVDLFLSVALTTRALLDSVFKSCVLFSNGDVRAYNKAIMDSLYSFAKLEWSTLPQNINHNIGDVLEEYAELSNRQKNKSTFYCDPAPTFKAKVDYMRARNVESGFASFFDECENFYNALSDMVHGGSSAIAASDHQGPQIVLNESGLKYVASAHQLTEFLGITGVLSHKLLVNLYLPVIVDTALRIEGAEKIRKKFCDLHLRLVRDGGNWSF